MGMCAHTNTHAILKPSHYHSTETYNLNWKGESKFSLSNGPLCMHTRQVLKVLKPAAQKSAALMVSGAAGSKQDRR